SVQAKYSGGSGTGGDPYQIANATDLFKLGADSNDYAANFILTADIEIGGTGSLIAAIIAPDLDNSSASFDGPKFTGFFNGDGHKISNMQINGDGFYYIGLFGGTGSGCLIYNLRLENVYVHGLHYVGGLVGASYSGAMIAKCSVSGNVIGGNESSHLGGLVGMNAGNIHECFSTAAVSGGDSSGDLGGLVGLTSDTTILLNSYATGSVTSGKESAFLGGLVGECYYSAVFGECYSTGVITADINSQYLGGLVGNNNSTDISHSYFLKNAGPANGNGEPLTNAQMKKKNSFINWNFDDTWQILAGNYPTLIWQSYIPVSAYVEVAKCSVTAGSKENSDKISFSGTMNATADDFNSANNSSDANFVEVAISPEDMNYASVITFPVNNKTWKKGKFSYSGTDANGVRKSFTYDPKTNKFAFSASNLDLSGLDCPMTANIDINDFNATAELDETIVNGPKVPMPIKLMTAVKNVLRVDNCTVKQNNKKLNSDQLTANGAFTVANPDPNMANWITEDLVITLGTQTFTIPADKLKPGKDKFSCTKAAVMEDSSIAAATFNFKLCSFTLTIKNTNIDTGLGNVDFGVQFTGFDESDEVTLP
ncbi:MAG: GLUG motif-containing protein, partial [Sedimentisphaerales bacterium]